MLRSLLYYLLYPLHILHHLINFTIPWSPPEESEDTAHTYNYPDLPVAAQQPKVYLIICKNSKVEKQAHHVVVVDFFQQTTSEQVNGVGIHLLANTKTGAVCVKTVRWSRLECNAFKIYELGLFDSASFVVPLDLESILVPDLDQRWCNFATALGIVSLEAYKAAERIMTRTGKKLWSAEVKCQVFAEEFVTTSLNLTWPKDVMVDYPFPSLQNLGSFESIDDTIQHKGLYND